MRFLLIFMALPLCAQDTRTVAEPVFPAACARLGAQLRSGPGGLPAASETSYDTAAVQGALDTCPAGQAVELQTSAAGDAFLLGPIQIRPGVTLLVDAGVTVFASRNPRDYDANASHSCGTLTTAGGGCLAFITANRADGGGIMGYGVIDGRGYLPLLLNGSPGPASWWDLANQANGTAFTQNCPRLIQVSNTNNFTVYQITLKNSPNFHVALGTDTNFTAWGVKIVTPYDARNTDGIDPNYSSNVTVRDCYISTGDDNVAIGGNNNPGASHISVINNHFGDGHGASIGSYTLAGVSDVLFDRIWIAGNTADGNQNGIRIKSDVSRGGLVQHIQYINFCMQNVRHPVVIDPFYTSGATGTLVPSYQDITLRNVHVTTEGTVKIQGHDSGVPTTITLDNVQVDGIKTSDLTVQNSAFTLGPGAVNFASMLKGSGVSVNDTSTAGGAPYTCPAADFAPVMGELIPAAERSISVRVSPTKAVPYQTYLTRLKTDPTATLELPPPTGTVTIYDSGAAIATAPVDGSRIISIPLPRLRRGVHNLTAGYSGDSRYPSIAFGSYALRVGRKSPRRR